MINKKSLLYLLLYCLLLAGIGTIARAWMPDQLVVHWNAFGQADGYGSTFTAIYLFPLVILASGALILSLPSIDPLKANVLTFRDSLHLFVMAFAGYMGYVYLLTLAWNLGLRFEMNRFLPPGFAILFYVAGHLLGRARRNYFIGIRTPWTLANDEVWDRTHARGAVTFKISAAISLLGILFPNQAVLLLLVPALIASVDLILYSYLEYRRLSGQS